MKMKPWFKTLMVIVIVIGPIIWLMFTADGQRRIDAVMLQLFGGETMLLDINGLNSRLGEVELKKVYPTLDWQCGQSAGEWGDQACSAAVSLWNEMPARRVSFYFKGGQLNAMQLDYRARYHSEMIKQLQQQLGRPSKGSGGGAQGVLQWLRPAGIVVIKAELGPADQAALIWVPPPPPSAASPDPLD
jgi:hypothetical protein